jgi:GNAT superfamily N-acetyltransferase
MLYEIAHLVRSYFPFLWDWIEDANSLVFKLRYRKELQLVPTILKSYSKVIVKDEKEFMLTMKLAEREDVEAMAKFFKNQPKENYYYFRPHDFDIKCLNRLVDRDSFISMVVYADSQIVGYFFLRSYFYGSSFLGKIVDDKWQGKGIGKLMCKAAMDVATTLGIRMFESINKNNLASLRSSSVLRQVVVKELEDDVVLIEDLPL